MRSNKFHFIFFIYFTPCISVQRRRAHVDAGKEPWLGLQDSEIGTSAERKRQRKNERRGKREGTEEGLVWKKGGVVGWTKRGLDDGGSSPFVHVRFHVPADVPPRWSTIPSRIAGRITLVLYLCWDLYDDITLSVRSNPRPSRKILAKQRKRCGGGKDYLVFGVVFRGMYLANWIVYSEYEIFLREFQIG